MEIEETEKTEQPAEKTQSGGDVDSIVNDLLESTPNISEHVIEQEQQKEQERQENLLTDDSGETFDPSKHASDENGQPVKTASGKFRKRSGRKPGATGNSDNTQKPKSQLGNVNANSRDNQPPAVDPGTIEAARAAAHLTFQAGLLLGGEDFQPIIDQSTGLNEPLQMENAYKNYFQARGVTDFPPGVALAVTMIAYAAPRFSQPRTKTRLQKVGAWFKKTFSRKKETPKNTDKKEG
jgi:hypothetical protein